METFMDQLISMWYLAHMSKSNIYLPKLDFKTIIVIYDRAKKSCKISF